MFKVGFIVPTWHYWTDPFKHQPYWELYYATVIRQAFGESDLRLCNIGYCTVTFPRSRNVNTLI